MSGDLDAVRLKLHRAKEHAEALHSAIKTFHWLDTYDASVKLDAQANELVVSMIVREQPPPEWGPLLGDFVHNLRSALDHLAIALVLSNKPTAKVKSIAFPMFAQDPFRPNAPAADKAAWKKRVKGMSTQQVAAIKAVQPFNNPLPANLADTLTVLNTLSNTDKHRRLIPVGGVAGETVTLVPRKMDGWQLHTTTETIPVGLIQDGAVVARFRITPLEPNPDVDVDIGAQVGIGITLEEGVPPGTDIDQVLRFLYTRVLDIVNDFEARFFV
jgi:hypothetical protein